MMNIDAMLALPCKSIQSTGLRPAEVEALLIALRNTEIGSGRARQIEQALMCGLYRLLAHAARQISNRTSVSAEDLLAEGQLHVLPRLRTFVPGRAKGLSLLPGYAAMIARQAMERYALAYRGAATISRWASRKLFRRVRGTRDTSEIEAAVLPGSPLRDVFMHESTPQSEVEASELYERLSRGIGELTDAQRDALERVFGFTGEQAVEIVFREWEQMDLLGCESYEATARVAVRRLREMIR